MIVSPQSKVCNYNGCKGVKMEYVGDDRLRCPKCKCSTNYFAEDNLLFTFTRDKKDGWLLQKVYYDGEWLEEFETLQFPRLAVYWTIYSGCRISKLELSSKFKFESRDQALVDISILDQFSDRFDVLRRVSVYVKEWAAGMQTPEGFTR